LNHPVHAVSPRKQPSGANGNGLCRKCNINQELKVQQLAVFTPINPARFDEEVDEFRYIFSHSLSNADVSSQMYHYFSISHAFIYMKRLFSGKI
jgi:hypothetical protein